MSAVDYTVSRKLHPFVLFHNC